MAEIIPEINTSHIALASKCRSVIKELLNLSNINVSELARRINLPQPTIHRLLTGKTEDPKLSTLTLIANYFSVSIDKLLGHAPLFSDTTNDQKLSHYIPLISWEDAMDYEKRIFDKVVTNDTNFILVDSSISSKSFYLKTKNSMKPKFSPGTILIVDPLKKPVDGNFVIVNYPNTTEATVREIVMDGPKKALLSIHDSSLSDEFTKDIILIGVIIETRFSYK